MEKDEKNQEIATLPYPKQPPNYYKAGFYILIGIFLTGIGFAAGYYLAYQKLNKVTEIPINEALEEPAIPTTEATDDIRPTENIKPTLTISKENTKEILSKLFAEKYNHNENEIIISISKETEMHISGGVKFSEEIGGGWFLAAKTSNGWVIADDGNGTITCSKIEPYNFPRDFVPECINETGKLIKR